MNHKLWGKSWCFGKLFFCEDLYNFWLHSFIEDMDDIVYSHIGLMAKNNFYFFQKSGSIYQILCNAEIVRVQWKQYSKRFFI